MSRWNECNYLQSLFAFLELVRIARSTDRRLAITTTTATASLFATILDHESSKQPGSCGNVL